MKTGLRVLISIAPIIIGFSVYHYSVGGVERVFEYLTVTAILGKAVGLCYLWGALVNNLLEK